MLYSILFHFSFVLPCNVRSSMPYLQVFLYYQLGAHCIVPILLSLYYTILYYFMSHYLLSHHIILHYNTTHFLIFLLCNVHLSTVLTGISPYNQWRVISWCKSKRSKNKKRKKSKKCSGKKVNWKKSEKNCVE
jgi:hypothetical protein